MSYAASMLCQPWYSDDAAWTQLLLCARDANVSYLAGCVAKWSPSACIVADKRLQQMPVHARSTLHFPAMLRLRSLELYAVTLGMVFEDADAFCERLTDLCVVYEMRIDGGPQRLAVPLAERRLTLASAQLKGREQTVAVFIRGCAFHDGAMFDHYRGMERVCACGRCWECLHARTESRFARLSAY